MCSPFALPLPTPGQPLTLQPFDALRLFVMAWLSRLSPVEQQQFREWVSTDAIPQQPADDLAHLTPTERNDVLELRRMRPDVLGDPHEVATIDRMIHQIVHRERPQLPPLPAPSAPAGELKEWADYTGRAIRDRRKDAGLTQVQLSDRTGIPQSHISRLENAEHSAHVSTLEKIARELGIDVNELMPPQYRSS